MARGIVLVGQGSQIEATQNLPDVRFLDIRFLFLSFAYASAKRECKAVSTIADEIWWYHTGGNLTIFDKDHDTIESWSRRFLQPSIQLRYHYYVQFVAIKARSDARTEFKILEHSLKGGWKLVVHRAVAVAPESITWLEEIWVPISESQNAS